MSTAETTLYRSATPVPYLSADADTYRAPTQLRHLTKSLPSRVLSEADLHCWRTYGYVIVRQAISTAAAKRLLDFAWDFQGLDPERPQTWYPQREFRSELDRDLHVYGFVEAYHHQLIWDSRQNPRVYDAFVDVWDCEQLWVTLDRLNLNPPNVGNRSRSLIAPTERGFDIELHWDVDSTPAEPPQRVQGLIALTDTSPELGGFQCCPELFRRFEKWCATQPAHRDPIRPDVDRTEFPIVRPQLAAGDLLIWNGMLAHGVAPNTSADGVRAVQYLSMMPALESHEELRRSRVDSWRTLSTPDWNPTLLGDAIKPEAERYRGAQLTELGARLLGLEPWAGHEWDRVDGDVACVRSA
ncbi:phytanoyl-CoA dioxygenase family protein [Kutzneria buriramensis]|uniref:Ectoine hydroxylase-related dioxygenase (Phytanoyl-CoA dioxygenase family) n=1 Tax=Kutzneria buriramensis TaxID=1045776 RepID=A0A3E0H1H2_9PSEU|nr:phytanoyl-CoA dioxygenase family protein [Kutzneria buriramensis]REH35676.1 ectoine hydroxylase-related dioxygenase (phytanoyl-CoA dioxygenase family) [Kutzneria buriramensis]